MSEDLDLLLVVDLVEEQLLHAAQVQRVARRICRESLDAAACLHQLLELSAVLDEPCFWHHR